MKAMSATPLDEAALIGRCLTGREVVGECGANPVAVDLRDAAAPEASLVRADRSDDLRACPDGRAASAGAAFGDVEHAVGTEFQSARIVEARRIDRHARRRRSADYGRSRRGARGDRRSQRKRGDRAGEQPCAAVWVMVCGHVVSPVMSSSIRRPLGRSGCEPLPGNWSVRWPRKGGAQARGHTHRRMSAEGRAIQLNCNRRAPTPAFILCSRTRSGVKMH